MERLRENNFLMSAIAISSAVVIALAFDLSTDLSNMFEIVEFPKEVTKYYMENSNFDKLIVHFHFLLISLEPFLLLCWSVMRS